MRWTARVGAGQTRFGFHADFYISHLGHIERKGRIHPAGFALFARTVIFGRQAHRKHKFAASVRQFEPLLISGDRQDKFSRLNVGKLQGEQIGSPPFEQAGMLSPLAGIRELLAGLLDFLHTGADDTFAHAQFKGGHGGFVGQRKQVFQVGFVRQRVAKTLADSDRRHQAGDDNADSGVLQGQRAFKVIHQVQRRQNRQFSSHGFSFHSEKISPMVWSSSASFLRSEAVSVAGTVRVIPAGSW